MSRLPGEKDYELILEQCVIALCTFFRTIALCKFGHRNKKLVSKISRRLLQLVASDLVS